MRYQIWSARVLSVAMPVLVVVASSLVAHGFTKQAVLPVSMPCQDVHWLDCKRQAVPAPPPWLSIRQSKKPPPLRHQPHLRPAEQVHLRLDGQLMMVSRRAALLHGYTLIDLSDGWVPNILGSDEGSTVSGNQGYRARFRDLANDRTNIDGEPLGESQRNYLELFGIPPTLSVIKARFGDEVEKNCLHKVDYEAIKTSGRIPYKYGRKGSTPGQKYRTLRRRLLSIAKKQGMSDLKEPERLIGGSAWMARTIARYGRLERQALGFEAIEKRLICAGLIRARERHKEGMVDYAFVNGLKRFWQKNRLFESWGFSRKTIAYLAKTPMEVNYEAFRRTLSERVIFATGIIEDGSVGATQFRDVAGRWHVVGNMTERYLDTTLTALGIDGPKSAESFLSALSSSQLAHLHVAVKLPNKPAYYSPRMDLRMVIDRGTVWYDYPWRPDGRRRRHKRERMPMVTLITRYNGQDIPLVRWPTTIGGWHTETDGRSAEFMRYKPSDVGHRVIRNIIAAPVWLPPRSTPPRTLVAYRRQGGKRAWQLKKELLGPGHRSAYGLVAGYLVIPGRDGRRDYDRGIRIHGSSNYLSITRKTAFSHGCHRMRNDQVMRLFGFVLAHRAHRVDGETPYRFRMKFAAQGHAFKFEIKNRGFRYTLTPPLPVEVKEGHIKGRRKKPWKRRFPIPRKRRTMVIN
jgi:hypothetical protein